MSRYEENYNKLIIRIKSPKLAQLGAVSLTAYTGFYIQTLKLRQKISGNKCSILKNINLKDISSIVPFLDQKQLAKELPKLQTIFYDVSIIVPCYNVEGYIRECITSILNQVTSFRYELILVNDGSTDCTEQILREYAVRQDVIVLSQGNHGIGYARNIGMEYATGVYVLFVDADDMLSPNILHALISNAYRHQADIVDVNYDFVAGNMHLPAKYLGQKTYHVNLKKHPDFILEITGFPWLKLMKRELFEGIAWPENLYFEDTLVRMTLLRRAKRYCHLNQVGYYYRKHNESLTNQLKEKGNNEDAFTIVPYLLALNHKIGLKQDETLYSIVLLQLSKYLSPRISSLPRKRQLTILSSCRDILWQLRDSKPKKLQGDYELIDQVISNLDWQTWRKLSKRV